MKINVKWMKSWIKINLKLRIMEKICFLIIKKMYYNIINKNFLGV